MDDIALHRLPNWKATWTCEPSNVCNIFLFNVKYISYLNSQLAKIVSFL